MSIKQFPVATSIIAVLLSCQAAHAQTNVISFNFSGNTDTVEPIGTNEAAGVFSATHWNNADSNSGTVGVIRYSDGMTASSGGTNTTLTFNSSQALDNQLDSEDPNYSTDPNSQLMDGYIQSGNQGGTDQAATVTVTNVPYTTYSVYAYFYNGDSQASTLGTFSLTSMLNPVGTSMTVETLDSFNPTSPFVEATPTSQGDYVVFTGLTSSNFTLSAVPENGDYANTPIPITGFQIVGSVAATPEPASAIPVALGLGMIGLLAARRRRASGLSA